MLLLLYNAVLEKKSVLQKNTVNLRTIYELYSILMLLTFFYRDDLMRAIKKLAILGSGFQVLPLQGRKLVQSVPSELNKDHTEVIQLAEVKKKFIYIIRILSYLH